MKEGTLVSEQEHNEDAPQAAVSTADEQGEQVEESAPDADVDQRSRRIAQLEEEGEIAADYLEELLDIADLGGDIELSVKHGRASVEVIADGADLRWLRRLVGEEGEVLDALQELTRLAVQARTGERSRLMLDIAGFRRERREVLTKEAQDAIDEVKKAGTSVALEPMNPFERKVVHDAVAAAGLVSDSEGVEPNRYVVIRPANKG